MSFRPLARVLPPEARLVFECIGPQLRASEMEAVLTSDLRWEAVFAVLDRESAAAHVWEVLSTYRDRLPEEVATRLRALARVQRFRQAMIEERLAEAVSALRGGGLSCLLLKGAALASEVYPSFAARPMRDIDLLVRRGEEAAALDILLRRGWRSPRGTSLSVTDSDAHHLPPLLDAGGGEIVLELHRSLLTAGHPFRLDLSDWWAHARPTVRGPSGAYILAPEHLLLHACIHLAFSHVFRQGAWRTFRDIRHIVVIPEFEWSRFVREAQQSRATTCAYWVLRLAQDIAGISIPPTVLRALSTPDPEPFRRALARHLALVLTPSERDCPSVTLRRILWSAAIRPRWSGYNRERPWTLFTGPIGLPAPSPLKSDSSPRLAGGRSPWLDYVSALLWG